MSVTTDSGAEVLTIGKGQGAFLRADDQGLLMRNVPWGRVRRIAWAEISRFADGKQVKEGTAYWLLVIVLHTGKRMVPLATHPWFRPPSETVKVIRELAERHGIPAELTGVPTKKGLPHQRALYRDPGGEAGLRYWNGSQWSPLLPHEVGKWSSRPVTESPGSWTTLPTAEAPWTWAATQVRRWTVWLIASAVVSAALLAGGLLTLLWWDRGPHHGHLTSVWFWVLGASAALNTLTTWRNRRLFLKLDEAAKDSVEAMP